jgi:hypothetical protein
MDQRYRRIDISSLRLGREWTKGQWLIGLILVALVSPPRVWGAMTHEPQPQPRSSNPCRDDSERDNLVQEYTTPTRMHRMFETTWIPRFFSNHRVHGTNR